jgi:phenylpropionate dioxygenase-like ring-hydroxylating dioxygenase large terminal subunit
MTGYSWGSRTADLEPIAHRRTLPSDIYYDPGVADAEAAALFRREWVPVGTVGRLRDTGSFITCQIAGEPVVVVNSGADGIRAFSNVCMHRGTLLCRGSGRIDAFVCPNHGWKYDLNGRLRSTPWFDRVAEFDPADASLSPVHIESFKGLVLVNLGDDPRPLLDYLGNVPEQLGAYELPKLTCRRTMTFDVAGNWKLMVENLIESYHVPYVHAKTVADPHLERFVYSDFDAPWGTWRNGNVDAVGQEAPRTLLEAVEARFVYLFPNIMIVELSGYTVAVTVLPRGVRSCELLCEFLFRDDSVEADGFYENWTDTLQDDVDIVGRVQEGLESRAFKSGRLAVPFEKSIADFQNAVREYFDIPAASA